MKLLLEFADSEVSRVDIIGEVLSVRFSAAQVYQLSDPLLTSGTVGYAREVELLLFGIRDPVAESICFGRVAQGRLELGGERLKRIPLPFQSEESARLELVFANGSELRASGSYVLCRFTGEVNFAESLFC